VGHGAVSLCAGVILPVVLPKANVGKTANNLQLWVVYIQRGYVVLGNLLNARFICSYTVFIDNKYHNYFFIYQFI